jgi:hypothetical protein
LYFPQPVTVEKGQFLVLTQTTGKVAIDTTSNLSISDMTWNSVIWSKLNAVTNQRFYLTTLNNFSSYLNTLSITHSYSTIGLYNITLTFNSSNQVFIQTVNVTARKFNIRLNIIIKLLNNLLLLFKLKIWI